MSAVRTAGRPTASRSSSRTSSPTEKSRMTTPISARTNAVSPGDDRGRARPGPTRNPPASSPDHRRLAQAPRDLLAELRADEQQEDAEHDVERRAGRAGDGVGRSGGRGEERSKGSGMSSLPGQAISVRYRSVDVQRSHHERHHGDRHAVAQERPRR